MSRTPSEARDLDRAWIASAGALGSLFGLPWVFVLAGPLPSVLYAFAAMVRGHRLRHGAPPRSLLRYAAIVVPTIVFFLGSPFSSTWPDPCFHLLVGIDREDRIASGTLFCVVGAVSIALWELLDFVLRRRSRRLQERDVSSPWGPMPAVARWIAGGALGWSLINELLLPNLFWLFAQIAAHGSLTALTDRDPCNPEVGWIAAVLYALAIIVSWRGGAARAFVQPLRQWDRPAITLIVFVALFVGQSARSVTLILRERAMLEGHGGAIECRCRKWEGMDGPLRTF